VVDNVKDAVENVKDEVSEGIHRGTADAEKKKRQLAGDEMTTGEKASSIIKQEKQTAQADIDAMKRDARTKT
jgi:predicted hydrolase (HD superfamily)